MRVSREKAAENRERIIDAAGALDRPALARIVFADDAARAHIRIEAAQRIEGAAEFERPHALEVLALEIHLGTECRIDGARGQHGGAVGMALNSPRGGGDVIEGRRAQRNLSGVTPNSH